MGDIELTCDAGMTNEHENDNSETARKEGLEPREMYDAFRRVVFQKQKCSLKGVGNISREQFQSIVFCINSEIDVNTDELVHTARSSSACFPVFQCTLSAA